MRKLVHSGILVSLLFAGQAFGAFSIADLQVATKAATDAFSVANPDHVEHFSGFKSWLAGDDAKVKIYVNHDGMAMEYSFLCHKHEEGVECHAQ